VAEEHDRTAMVLAERGEQVPHLLAAVPRQEAQVGHDHPHRPAVVIEVDVERTPRLAPGHAQVERAHRARGTARHPRFTLGSASSSRAKSIAKSQSRTFAWRPGRRATMASRNSPRRERSGDCAPSRRSRMRLWTSQPAMRIERSAHAAAAKAAKYAAPSTR